MVLIPFKARQWFKPTQKERQAEVQRVLIPFKAGQWFKRITTCYAAITG